MRGGGVNTANAIDTDITPHDEHAAKFERKSAATLAVEILEHLQNGAPYGTTFIQEIPLEQRQTVEVELKHAFEVWANSWIAPKCRQIIAKSR